MDRFQLEILREEEQLKFEVIDYLLQDEGDHCKFEIFRDGKMVASFEPDNRGMLHICKNCGVVDEQTLHLIADKLERLAF